MASNNKNTNNRKRRKVSEEEQASCCDHQHDHDHQHEEQPSSSASNNSNSTIVIDLCCDDNDSDWEEEKHGAKRKRKKKASTSSAPSSSFSSSPTAKSKKQKAEKPKKEVPEKRLKRWRASVSVATSDRIYRAKTQRLYLLQRELTQEAGLGGPAQIFHVLGSTGNVYRVKICKLPQCSCPDSSKGHHCKHILFVFLRVLRLDKRSELLYQAALLSSELQQIFDGAPQTVASNALADEAARRRFEELRSGVASSESTSSSAEAEASSKRKPIGKEDFCAVCFEEMYEQKEKITYCNVCGNNLHEDCWTMWKKNKEQSNEMAACVYCRTENMGRKEKSTTKAGKEGYQNLAAFQHDTPTERDTSTYRYSEYYDYGRD